MKRLDVPKMCKIFIEETAVNLFSRFKFKLVGNLIHCLAHLSTIRDEHRNDQVVQGVNIIIYFRFGISKKKR